MPVQKNCISTIEQKYQIIKHSIEFPEKNKQELANYFSNEFKIPISRRVVDYTLGNKQKTLDHLEDIGDSKRKNVNKGSK